MTNDADAKRIEAAKACGCNYTTDEAGPPRLYAFNESQLIAFAKTCEREGRSQIATALRKAAESMNGDAKRYVLAAADTAEAFNKQASK